MSRIFFFLKKIKKLICDDDDDDNNIELFETVLFFKETFQYGKKDPGDFKGSKENPELPFEMITTIIQNSSFRK